MLICNAFNHSFYSTISTGPGMFVTVLIAGAVGVALLTVIGGVCFCVRMKQQKQTTVSLYCLDTIKS